jgi:6-phosphogluconolactonase
MLEGPQDPAALALHPTGAYLYAADNTKPGAISAYRIDASGKLTILNTTPSGGSLPVFATVDRTGKHLLVANYGGTIAVLPIDSSGRLGNAIRAIAHKGSGPDRQPHPHSIYLSPDNRFALAMDAGLDEVFVYRFDETTGSLTPGDPPFVTLPDAAPRHFAFHPNGAVGYVLGEKSKITTVRWDAQAGTLTPLQTLGTLQPDFHGWSGAADVAVHPNGRFVYASNRGDGTVAVFAIGVDGTLSPLLQYEPVLGKQPSNLKIDPSGNYLFVSNVFSNNLVQFQIDPQSGRLNPTGFAFEVPSPGGMQFLPVR